MLNTYTIVYLHFSFFNNTTVFAALPQSQSSCCKVLSCKVSIEVCLVTYLQAGRGTWALPSVGTLTKQSPSSSAGAGGNATLFPLLSQREPDVPGELELKTKNSPNGSWAWSQHCSLMQLDINKTQSVLRAEPAPLTPQSFVCIPSTEKAISAG